MSGDLRLPPEDRGLSPYTGFTRAHWEATADGLVRAAWRWATPGGALLDLPGRPSRSGVRSDGLEGYARTFLAAAFRVAGAAGEDPYGLLGRYADGLAAGTRTPGRDDAESWPPVRDHPVGGQPMVESASVALGLRLTRPWLWDRLDDGVRDRAERWLRGALRHTPAPNNWYLFPLTVAGFLESVGRGDRHTARAVERGLELLEGWYRGDGWYADGDGRAFDHYNGWALHLYPLLHARLAGDRALLEVYGPRLREHLEGFSLLFGGDGAPVHFGRSLTYRFAAGAAVGVGALTGYTPLAPGVSRRLLSGCLRYFLDRGAVDARDGLLTPGWHGPHEATLQSYSGPASPYWASKAFVALLVPPEDPLWTAREEAAPAERGDRVLALPAPGLLVQVTGADGVARLHNHGSDAVHPAGGDSPDARDVLYGRFAYSTRTGPTSAANAPDNHVSVEVGAVASERCRIRPLGAGHGDGWGWAASWHRPVFPGGAPVVPGLRAESVTVARGRHELRAHRLVGLVPGARVRLSGWATGPEEPLVSRLHGLYGWEGPAEEVRAPQGTAFTRWAVLPRLSVTVPEGGTVVLVALASLTGAGDAGPLAGVAVVERVRAEAVEVRWAGDGALTRITFAPGVTVTHAPG
ncbi:DUF2264 domain-containing protein [Streptomyces sp. WAC05374]|uniref:DUF2264 domain-containing protein n=2 Tax=Streptomyces sp. WAC05374 TaxID=2487420 RepID=UPI0010554221|nr:DUF2264 domain-containing protein [Streptomyces sp. WAC05374]TDF45985.1 DUF2264 domain-containing protein [Streptomyces sp. WAC05374]TDF52979.1 DUF2264 domain-containing protein [Streptomyces sp. WAC05374]TDF58193.1 DUF2264 domain-containing protein [Streptomyces sp. WAC05374]